MIFNILRTSSKWHFEFPLFRSSKACPIVICISLQCLQFCWSAVCLPRRAFWQPKDICHHSRPQRPRSFWSAPRIEAAGRLRHRKSAIHGLIVKFGKPEWLKMQNEYSAHAQKIGFGQRSRFLVLTTRIAASGVENDVSLPGIKTR